MSQYTRDWGYFQEALWRAFPDVGCKLTMKRGDVPRGGVYVMIVDISRVPFDVYQPGGVLMTHEAAGLTHRVVQFLRFFSPESRITVQYSQDLRDSIQTESRMNAPPPRLPAMTVECIDFGNPMLTKHWSDYVWDEKASGPPTEDNIGDWVAGLNASFRPGGINYHVSMDLGYTPQFKTAIVSNARTGEEAGRWEAPPISQT